MAENLYRQLADQVREHDYDILRKKLGNVWSIARMNYYFTGALIIAYYVY